MVGIVLRKIFWPHKKFALIMQSNCSLRVLHGIKNLVNDYVVPCCLVDTEFLMQSKYNLKGYILVKFNFLTMNSLYFVLSLNFNL